jgi:hypothetical protein
MPAPFVASYSRWRTLLVAAIGAGFVTFGLWILGAFGAPHLRGSQGFRLVFGVICVLFFGLVTFDWLKKMVSASDAITIDARGVRAVQWSDKLIPWTEIVAVKRRKVSTSAFTYMRFLSLELQNGRNYPATSLFRGTRLNKMLGYGDVSFNAVGTDKSIDEVADALEEHWRYFGKSASEPADLEWQ